MQAYELEVPTIPTSAPLATIHSAEKANSHLRGGVLPSGGDVYQPPPGPSAADAFPFATARKADDAGLLPSKVWATEQ